VPANKLAELPAMRYALSTHATFAKSACGLLKNDSSPRKENPRLRMTRLILAEIFCRCLCLFIRTFFRGIRLQHSHCCAPGPINAFSGIKGPTGMYS